MRRTPPRPAAFTLVETVMSLAIIGLIATAVAALSVAVADGWHEAEIAQTTLTQSSQSSRLVHRLISGSRHILLATADGEAIPASASTPSTGAALLLWKGDANDDGMIQASEIALLEHNPAEQTIVLHEIPSDAAIASSRYYTTQLDDSADIEAFRNLPERRTLVVARGVTSAAFRKLSGAGYQRNPIEFQLKFGAVRTEYGTVTLRGPLVPSDT